MFCFYCQPTVTHGHIQYLVCVCGEGGLMCVGGGVYFCVCGAGEWGFNVCVGGGDLFLCMCVYGVVIHFSLSLCVLAHII